METCELDLFFFFSFSSDQASNLVVGEKEQIPLVPEEAPASETDINLEVSFAEQAVNQKESSKDGTQKQGNNTLLPVRSTLFRCH